MIAYIFLLHKVNFFLSFQKIFSLGLNILNKIIIASFFILIYNLIYINKLNLKYVFYQTKKDKLSILTFAYLYS